MTSCANILTQVNIDEPRWFHRAVVDARLPGGFIDDDRCRGTLDGMPKLPVRETVPTAQVCSAPLTSPLSVEDAARLSMRLKALADPARLRLVSLLLASESGELCTCDVTLPLGLSQPTVSHHFKKLTEAGLVIGERRGTWTYYRIVPEALAALAAGISPATTVASC
jgi:ArsR family transcriptional regulator, arsenate/arsenite/antimonite-responsive transcriptional repressor